MLYVRLSYKHKFPKSPNDAPYTKDSTLYWAPGPNRDWWTIDVLVSQKLYDFLGNLSSRQFKSRLQKVEDHLNSETFAAPDGGGLRALAKEMLGRCKQVIDLKGKRVPK